MVEAEVEDLKINLEVVVPSEEVRVSVTKDGYVKRSSIRSYTASNGEEPSMKETDRLIHDLEVNTTDTLLFFTKKGSYLFVPVHQLPETKWKDGGQHIANIVTMDQDDPIIHAIPVQEFREDRWLLFATKSGMVKRSVLKDYHAQRHSKALTALKLKTDDELINVYLTNGEENLFLATKKGYGLWFSEEEVSVTGQRTAGVKGINLKEGDQLAALSVFNNEQKPDFVLVTQRAAVKRMALKSFEKTTRAKRGVIMLKELKKAPHEVAACMAVHGQETLVLESETRTRHAVIPKQLRLSDRYTNGSFIYDVQSEGPVQDVWMIEPEPVVGMNEE